MKLPPEKNDLMHGIPRGVTTRRLSQQTAPQARFLNPSDVLSHQDIHYHPKKPNGKILLGAIGQQLIGIEDNRHILTVAGSRAGKSVTVIGNLLFYQGSILCTDPKGELSEKTAKQRADMGQKIYVLDPFQITKGQTAWYRAKFNPMAHLKLDNKTIIEDALILTDALVVSSGKESDPHWNETASHFIMGVILMVALDLCIEDEERHLITVRSYINRALELDEDEEGNKVFVIEELAKSIHRDLRLHGFEDIANVMLAAIIGFYDKATDERGSVLSTVRRHTQFLDFQAMKSVLTGHDFDLSDLKTHKDGVSIYLVLPATRMTQCQRWLRLFVNQLIQAMEETKQQNAVPVLVVLDEFPVLGYMNQLQNAAGQIASFGVKLWVILQDWGQGVSLYGDRFESFAANAGILQAFGNVDITTTEYLSKRLGQTLIKDNRLSEVSAEQREKGLHGEQENFQSVPLLSPDEISRIFSRNDSLKRELILWAGYHPMVLSRVEYFDPKSPIHTKLNK